jgi:hypothetical protein
LSVKSEQPQLQCQNSLRVFSDEKPCSQVEMY